MPELDGTWLLLKESGDDVADDHIKPWIFEGNKIVTYDKSGTPGNLTAHYFKLNGMLFMDITIDEMLEREMNNWWSIHALPIHTLCKVLIQEENMILLPLSVEWFGTALEEKKISLPVVMSTEEGFLVTATPEEWRGFLEQYGQDNESFSPKLQFELKRQNDKKWGELESRINILSDKIDKLDTSK
jgi:hypothetical protein